MIGLLGMVADAERRLPPLTDERVEQGAAFRALLDLSDALREPGEPTDEELERLIAGEEARGESVPAVLRGQMATMLPTEFRYAVKMGVARAITPQDVAAYQRYRDAAERTATNAARLRVVSLLPRLRQTA